MIAEVSRDDPSERPVNLMLLADYMVDLADDQLVHLFQSLEVDDPWIEMVAGEMQHRNIDF